MNNKLNPKERKYIGTLKENLPCSICDAPPPSEFHHTKQGNQFTGAILCVSCHRGSILGWHGEKRAWAIRKMDENDALNVTIRRAWEFQTLGRVVL